MRHKRKLAVAALLVVIIADVMIGRNAVDLPDCNSPQAKHSLKAALEYDLYKNPTKMQLSDWDKPAEVAFDKKTGVCKCMADVVLNTGHETIAYTFAREKGDPAKFLTQFKTLDSSQAHALRAEAMEHNKSGEQKARDTAQALQREQEQRREREQQQALERQQAQRPEEEKVQALKNCYEAHDKIDRFRIVLCQMNFDTDIIQKAESICRKQAANGDGPDCKP